MCRQQTFAMEISLAYAPDMRLCLLLLCCALSLAACTPGSGIAPETAKPGPTTTPAQIEGLASWYGPKFAGRPTANGEIFNPNELTAAHKTWPFGTQVRVTNLRNGRTVIVRINDRGPFVGQRIIDLSRAAAEQIGMIQSGVEVVRLEPLDLEQRPSSRMTYRSYPAITLASYEVVSRHHPPGTRLELSAKGSPVQVEVVRGAVPRGLEVDLLVSQMLYRLLGPEVELTLVN